MPLVWRGAEIAAAVTRAAVYGVNKTLADCVPYAKRNHPWVNRTDGTAEGSIQVVDWGAPHGMSVVGRWGSVTVNYFIYLELGTSRMPAYPILRPTADVMYPRLRAYIREGWMGGV